VTDLITAYRQLTYNIELTTRRASQQPTFKHETEDYLANIGSVKSIGDFLQNDRVYGFALKAFGLKDMIYAKAFIKKALTEGIDTPGSFTLKLADSRFRDFVETFNFARYGNATTAFSRTQQGTVDRYLRNAIEEDAGNQSEALRLAMYFQRKAPFLTSEYGILADKAIYTVVRTALGLPTAISGNDIDKQAAIIGSRVNCKDFADAAKLDKFITRFIAQFSVQDASSARTNAAVIINQSSTGVIDMSTLMSIQSIKKLSL
jgi:Protein of unknown function (DUF1217)